MVKSTIEIGRSRRRPERRRISAVGGRKMAPKPQRLLLLTMTAWFSVAFLSNVGKDAAFVSALQGDVYTVGRRHGQVATRYSRPSRFQLYGKDSSTSGADDSNQNDRPRRARKEERSTKSSTISTITLDSNEDLSSLQNQAAKLREEANALQIALQKEREDKLAKDTAKVDKWIEELLIEAKVNENTELLKTVDQVLERLTEDRYSAEQVNKIFKRLCELRQQESRSNQSPLMSLLVDACCQLDCMERNDNPNKRWNHKVERLLQKKLFARDWNIDLDDDEDDAGNPWKLR